MQVARIYMKVVRVFNIGSAWLGQVLAMVMMVAVISDVVGRYLFKWPVPGATEISMLSMVLIVFLGLAFTQSMGGHIRVTLLSSRFNPGFYSILEILVLAAALFFIGAMGWFGGITAIRSVETREVAITTFRVPLYIARLGIPVGCGLMVLQLFIDLVRAVKRLVTLSPITGRAHNLEAS